MIEDYMRWEQYILRRAPDFELKYDVGGRRYEIGPDDRVYVAGMGGSGVVGDLLRDLSALYDWPFDVVVVKDYFFRGRRGLMIAVSYSGNTVETITAAQEALRRGIPVVAITTGGRLAELGIPTIRVPKASAPRAALPQMFTAALWVLRRIYGIEFALPDSLPYDSALEERLKSVISRRPTIVAPASMQGVAYRVKNEINENAKMDSPVEILPEAHHNWIEGASSPLMALTSEQIPLEHRRRVEITVDLVGGELFKVDMTIGGVLTFLKHVGLATAKLALERGIDPLKTPRIDLIKQRL
ncbi:bifunctional phosphoglucose/phosphomannose isomerase [Thermoproteus tenax]|uniref:Glucose-6-phosphate isomerase n=2 Tax=Thermoproteus tenax TaxID=2271 RepID=G4RPY4_THETK|nr:bifunctional phosphoglucose/phosphomannose isomerase [Thermoproteus tenax]CAF18453.1 glucose-6-phosphate isomerase [Thermoproteus tenax]CCC81629.1 Glucose-6-phosphate isomerase [Thermoproteus tenax Kra 1]